MTKGHSVFVKISLSNDTHYLVTSEGRGLLQLLGTPIFLGYSSLLCKKTPREAETGWLLPEACSKPTVLGESGANQRPCVKRTAQAVLWPHVNNTHTHRIMRTNTHGRVFPYN